ncbi:MAG: hypothetical protein PHF84_08430, partial [bacterium]|nr:hypothetical protein [bacterium]
ASVAGQNVSWGSGNFAVNGNCGNVGYDVAYNKDGGITGKVDYSGNTVSYDGSTLAASGSGYNASVNKDGSGSASVAGQNVSWGSGNFAANGNCGNVGYDVAYNKDGGITGKVDYNGNTVSYDGSTLAASGSGYNASVNKDGSGSASVAGQNVSWGNGNFSANGNCGDVGYDIAYSKDGGITGKVDYEGNCLGYDGKTINLTGENYSLGYNQENGAFTAGFNGQELTYQNGDFKANGNYGDVGYDIAYNKDGGISGKVDYNGNTISYDSGKAYASGSIGDNGTYSLSTDGKSITANASYGGFGIKYENGQFSIEGPKLITSAGQLLSQFPSTLSPSLFSKSFMKSFLGGDEEEVTLKNLEDVEDYVFGSKD